MLHDIDTFLHRHPDHQVEPLFVERWSPRAMSGEPLDPGQLEQLFEAARWAPSSYNAQPWRFVYAERNSEHWDAYFDLLVEGNQRWCERAAVLMVLLSRHIAERNGEPFPSHALDTGAAWQNLALQGAKFDLVVHGMIGFDRDRARTVVNAPDEFTVQAMIAVGRPGGLELLSDSAREREVPSPRKTIQEIAFAGRF
ncbi:MAG: nitroreductase family protein [Chromatiales bacterium]|jgi:nitroreductase|nr:nitroreductase family protein [Chromatiales bacterium]